MPLAAVHWSLAQSTAMEAELVPLRNALAGCTTSAATVCAMDGELLPAGQTYTFQVRIMSALGSLSPATEHVLNKEQGLANACA